MAKAKPQAKKSQPAKPAAKKSAGRVGLLKSAAKAAAKLVKSAAQLPKKVVAEVKKPAAKAATAPKAAAPAKAPSAKAPAASAKAPAASAKAPAAAPKAPAAAPSAPVKAAKVETPAAPPVKAAGKKGAGSAKVTAPPPPPAKVQQPRATKLPPVGEPMNKRDLEQVLTVGQGRGVFGEGSLKGRLAIKEGLPALLVIGRDKRELQFILQGPDQEVLPAYLDHKVSVSGLIRKVHNYGGTVDVRKYSAKKPDEVAPVEASPPEQKLRYLSPGEVAQVCSAGMGAGMKGFGTMRGSLEMSGEEYLIVVSNGGTRHQVTFVLAGKAAKGLKKHIGQTVQVTGVVDKTSGWGGTVEAELAEVRPPDFRAVAREQLEVAHVEGVHADGAVDVKLNHGLTVRLPEKAGHTWAIEPTVAKRVGLREANFEYSSSGPASREFFFTPRNPGLFEVEFFLAKALTPAQVAKTFKLNVTVKP